MRKVWFVGLCIFLFLLTGCSDKSGNSKINDSIKDNYTVSYSVKNHDFNSECFVGIININGKMMYLFRNMPESFHFFNDEIDEYDRPLHMGLCMYEYKDNRYCLYKELIGEELEPGYSFYEEKYDKYIVFAENEDSECIDGVYVYDLNE
ncbi:MAG: hypothetical protein K6G26_03125, partial [Lachnospiraceae bacterium]|nr:hypothetical protein [Lachnospiraceae bacterium]